MGGRSPHRRCGAATGGGVFAAAGYRFSCSLAGTAGTAVERSASPHPSRAVAVNPSEVGWGGNTGGHVPPEVRMVWLGLVLLVAGAVPALTADGDLGGVDITVAGAAVMAVGAVLLIAGILRLRRRRRVGPTGRAAQAYYRTPTGKIVAMVVAVIYIVSPVDLIPDVFLPFGVVDDATALTWLLFALGQEYTRRSRTERRAP
ncbi:YkvA family protein [Spirillospora sp. NPDC049024]